MKAIASLIGALFCAGVTSTAQNLPAIDTVLTHIQSNLAVFEAALPDFVANESVVSLNVVSGVVKHRTLTESRFTCVRKAQGNDSFLSETREVTSVDGKAAGKGQRVRGPILFGGGFGSVLNSTFGAKNIAFHNYRVAGFESVGDTNALVIAFSPKENQKGLTFGLYGKRVFTKDTGKAWLDPASMQILRLERKYTDLPIPYEVNLRVDYAPVAIEGKSLLMPKTVTASMDGIKSKRNSSGSYIAQYSDYRKFSVSSGITYDGQ